MKNEVKTQYLIESLRSSKKRLRLLLISFFITPLIYLGLKNGVSDGITIPFVTFKNSDVLILSFSLIYSIQYSVVVSLTVMSSRILYKIKDLNEELDDEELKLMLPHTYFSAHVTPKFDNYTSLIIYSLMYLPFLILVTFFPFIFQIYLLKEAYTISAANPTLAYFVIIAAVWIVIVSTAELLLFSYEIGSQDNKE